MHDPDLIIRTSGEQRLSQLPAVAVGLLRAGVPRRAVAGLHRARRSRRALAEYARAPAALRRPLMAARVDARRRAVAAIARRRSAPRGRVRDRDPSSCSRSAVVRRLAAAARASLGAGLHARAASTLLRARAPGRSWPASSALVGLLVAAQLGDTRHGAAGVRRVRSRCSFAADARRTPRASGARARGHACSASAWIGLALAHAVLLRDLPHGDGDRRRRARRDLRRRHRRLPRRPRVRRDARWRRGSRRTRRSRAWSSGSSSASLGVWFAGLYQDWLRGHGRAAARRRRRARRAGGRPVRVATSSATPGIKDTGRLFGAHGGALDRLDARAVHVVVGYYVWRAML